MSKAPARAIPGDRIRISVDPSTEPFWAAAKEGRLTAPQCSRCGRFHLPPRPYCPECQGHEFNWPTLSGKATVYSFAICHKSPYPDIPDFDYVPVVVDLDGAPGTRLVSNLIDVSPADVAIGMAVEVNWNPIQDGWKIPIFRPAK
jgi:uncharacterized OB-fold protein